MRIPLGVLWCLVVMLTSACQYLRFDPGIDPKLVRKTACASWRQIGIKYDPDQPCPAPPAGWSVRPFFEPPEGGGPYEKALSSVKISPVLSRFCVYERLDDGNVSSLESLLEERGTGNWLVRLGGDCPEVFGAAAESPLQEDVSGDELLNGILEEHFLTQAGKVAGLCEDPYAFCAPADYRGGKLFGQHARRSEPPFVRLAILDTQFTADHISTRAARSAHGYALAHMARNLACESVGGEERCAARITTRLATPVVLLDGKDSRKSILSEDHGGFWGRIFDVATAVGEEVRAWQVSREERLVLDLPLGWNAALFGGLEVDDRSCRNLQRLGLEPDAGMVESVRNDPGYEVAPLAVFCALQDAACRGALVFAAAGNRSPGPEDPRFDVKNGLLLPAAWETRTAPGLEACEAILGESPNQVHDGNLIYAVAGVQTKGVPLVNFRPGIDPQLAAYGDHAVVRDHQGEYTAVLTGTSVSTTVLAATAAVVWASDQLLSQKELIEKIRRQSDNFCWPAQRVVKAVDAYDGCRSDAAFTRKGWGSLCRALGDESCSSCDCLPCYYPCPGPQDPPVLCDEDIDTILGDSPIMEGAFPSFKQLDRCSAKRIYYLDRPPRNPCPSDQFLGFTALMTVTPQPHKPPTSSCAAYSESCSIILDVRDDWRGGRLHDATLQVGEHSFAIHQLDRVEPLEPGGRLVVHVPDEICEMDRDFKTPVSVSFTIRFGNKVVSVADLPFVFARPQDLPSREGICDSPR